MGGETVSDTGIDPALSRTQQASDEDERGAQGGEDQPGSQGDGDDGDGPGAVSRHSGGDHESPPPGVTSARSAAISASRSSIET